jgi:Lipocalin-like domain
MERRSILNIVIVVLAAIGLDALSNSAVSQQKTLREQLVGTWSFVSSNAKGTDGRPQWGENPRGLFIMTDSGHFSWQVFRSDRPHFASNNRLNATADELKAINQGTLAYFGTYSVDEAVNTVTFRTVASTYPNSEGEIIKRVITKISPDEMIYTNLANTLGERVEAGWKRLK